MPEPAAERAAKRDARIGLRDALPTLMIPARTLPGPESSPVSNLYAMRRDPLGFFERLARDYGDVVPFSLGSDQVYLVKRPDLIKEILVSRDRHFEKWFAVERTKELLGQGLFVSEGKFHLRQRRMSQPAFHHRRIAEYARVMRDCSLELRDRWHDGETVDVAGEMNWLALVIVTKTLFGAEVDPGEARIIRESLNVILDKFERATLPPDEAREFDEARARLSATVYRMIAERRESGEESPADLLSLLIHATDEEEGVQGMTDEQLHDEAMTLFLAGHETTANALMWTWYALSQHPEVEAKLHAELDETLQGTVPSLDDIPRLTYLKRVFSESLRLYPPVWIFGRRALEDVRIGEYEIEKGSIVLVSTFITQRDERFFANPDRFDPERWTEGAVAARPKFSFFPFSAGSRQCLGEAFAWMESSFALAVLAQKWNLALAPDQKVELYPQLTLRSRHGMRMIVTERS